MDPMEIFRDYLDERFGKLHTDIQDVSTRVADLDKRFFRGNGQPPLCEEVAFNTKFREEMEDNKKAAKNRRRAATWSLVVAVIIAIVTSILNVLGAVSPGT